MLASTIAANPDRIDRGSGLLKRFPGDLVNLDRPALRCCSARRIRRAVSAIDLSSQPTSSPFFYPSLVRPAQADARDRQSGNRSGSSPCHWRWCQRRFVRLPLAWRRSAVGVAHRAAPPKYQSATISGRFKSRVRMGKLLQRRVSAPKPRRWPGPRGGTASERGTRGNRAELKHGDQSGPLGPSAAFSTVHPWNSFYRAFGLQ